MEIMRTAKQCHRIFCLALLAIRFNLEQIGMSLGGRFFKKGKTQMNRVYVFVLVLCFCLASTAAFGPERYGSIEGTVKDQQGALVPVITLTLTGPAAFNPTLTTAT